MKVIAVNGKKFSPAVLRDALRKGRRAQTALELLVENTEYYRTFNSTITAAKNILIWCGMKASPTS